MSAALRPHRRGRVLDGLATAGRLADALEASIQAPALCGPASPAAGIVCINLGLLAGRMDEAALAADDARLAAVDALAAESPQGDRMHAQAALAAVDAVLADTPRATSALRALIADAQAKGPGRIAMGAERSLLELLLRILPKMGVGNRTGAARQALDLGIVQRSLP